MKDLKYVSNWVIKTKKKKREELTPSRLAITSGILQR